MRLVGGGVILLTLPAWVLVAIALSIPFGLVFRSTRRSWAFWGWIVVAAMTLLFQGSSIPHGGWAIAWYLDRDARPTLEDLDLALSRVQREEVVRRAEGGLLVASTDAYAGPEDFALPDGFTGLTYGGAIWVAHAGCGITVFFRTVAGFSPDPYSGFEYATPGCRPEVDPFGSGAGDARDLGGGWYWIDAS